MFGRVHEGRGEMQEVGGGRKSCSGQLKGAQEGSRGSSGCGDGGREGATLRRVQESSGLFARVVKGSQVFRGYLEGSKSFISAMKAFGVRCEILAYQENSCFFPE